MSRNGQHAPSLLSSTLNEFTLYLRHTFGNSLRYVGTTTKLDGDPHLVRDIDVLVVLTRLNEGHIRHVWRTITLLRAKSNAFLDCRIYSEDDLARIPSLDRFLLSRFLEDHYGANPFMDFQPAPNDLRPECRTRIKEQEKRILQMVPRVAANPDRLRELAQSTYDAIRAYLVFEGHPCACKEEACDTFCERYPQFSEARSIYDGYLYPQSKLNLPELIEDALVLVKHLAYRSESYAIRDELVLVNTPSSLTPHPRDDYLQYDANMPLGLVCLSSYLESLKLPVRILDAYALNLGAASTVDALVAGNGIPRLVGFNAASPNIHVVHRIARYLKRISADITVICGGPHASLAKEHTLSTGDVDFVVAGEGELALAQLTHAVLAGDMKSAKAVPGVYSRSGSSVVGSPQTLEFDLASMPLPRFDHLPLDRYFSKRKRLFIHTSRGCSFRCVYCSVPRCWGSKVREIPMASLFAHLESIVHHHHPDELQIVDDNFSHKHGQIIAEFCSSLQNRAIRVKWKCQVRADQLSVEVIPVMAAAGCFEVDMGVESGSPSIQQYIRKGLDLEKTKKVVRALRENGIVAKAFFIVGFPDESYQQVADTINYAVELKGHGLSDVAFFPAMPFPGTEMADKSGTTVYQGAIIDDTASFGLSFANVRLRKYSARPEVSLNQLFTPEQLRQLVKFSYDRFESSQAVSDLQREFQAYVEQEEALIYGI